MALNVKQAQLCMLRVWDKSVNKTLLPHELSNHLP